MERFETFEHTADIGLRSFGKNLEECFENAAYGMFSIMYRRLDRVKPKEEFMIECSGYDIESLFVEWLNSLLSKSDLEEAVFCEFKVNIDIKEFKIRAVIKGERISKKFEPAIEVKAATYSNLKVEKVNDVYIAQCILDI
jgi:SHS2 domain-containing protein